MRTTLTLDPDVANLLAKDAAQRGVSFKVAVNDAIRQGLGASPAVEVSWPTQALQARVDLTHALRAAADLEDQALVAKLREGR